MKSIDIWFHCWCGNQNIPVSNSRLLNLINDKLVKLTKSDLYANASNIYIVASQISSKNEFIFDDIQKIYPKIKLIKLTNPEIGNECDTLNLMIEKYKNSDENYNVLYFHSKGLSYPEFHPITKRMIKWTRYMDLFLIKYWQYSQNILQYYDTHGIFLFEPGQNTRKIDEPENRKTYAGHFWWSKSEYLRKLDFISKSYQKSRGEFHLLDFEDVKYHVIPTDYPWLKDKDFHKDETNDEYFFPEGW